MGQSKHSFFITVILFITDISFSLLFLSGCSKSISPLSTPTIILSTAQLSTPFSTPFPTMSNSPLPPTPPLSFMLTPATIPPKISRADILPNEIDKLGSITILGATKPVLWNRAWCAQNKEILKSNFSHLSWQFMLGDIIQPLEVFSMRVYKDFNINQECISFDSILDTWQTGKHHLGSIVTINEKISDGNQDFSPTSYMNDYYVFVSDPANSDLILKQQEKWPKIIQESFEELAGPSSSLDEEKAWQITQYEDEWFNGFSEIIGGEYVFTINHTFQNMTFRQSPYIKVLSGPFMVSLRAKNQESTSGKVCIGLYFHYEYESGNFYQFTICDTQEFSVDAHIQDEWDGLLPWTKSPFILPYQENKISVLVVGNQFTFSVNDQVVGQTQDERLHHGYIGFLIKSNINSSAKIGLDDFTVQAP